MARPSRHLVRALRDTAHRIEQDDVPYSWGHMGSCNCGHLAQTVTRLDRAEIHRRAQQRAGDWGEQALEACAGSGIALDHVIEELLDLGLERRDLQELEELSSRTVLRRVPTVDGSPRHLRRNCREDAVLYLRAWADLLEEALEDPVDGSRAAAGPARGTRPRQDAEGTPDGKALAIAGIV